MVTVLPKDAVIGWNKMTMVLYLLLLSFSANPWDLHPAFDYGRGFGWNPAPFPWLHWEFDSVLISWLPGDFDFDGNVDYNDLIAFDMCYSGPGIPMPWPYYPNGMRSACWILADFDDDGDVDMVDFSVMQILMEPVIPPFWEER